MFDMLDLRFEARREKWRRDLLRNDPPPFLGPLVSTAEAAEALGRSATFVRRRIDDGRLNTWKDPITRRVWILKDDVDILGSDLAAREADRSTRTRAAGKKRRKKEPEPEPEGESEDLDAIGGWEAPAPPEPRGASGILEDQQRESEFRFVQKECENDEWYAAELARLEGRDPAEAVRQLQLDRGWLTPERPEDTDSAAARLPLPAREGVRGVGPELTAAPSPHESPARKPGAPQAKSAIRNPRSEIARPVSYSHPNAKPGTKPEPYLDPSDQSAIHNPKSEIPVPFPIGWVDCKVACSMLDCSRPHLLRLGQQGKLQRRKAPVRGNRPRWLYDSVELEQLAEQRLDRVTRPEPRHRLDWWGSRANEPKLQEFDWLITVQEAAGLLGVSKSAVYQMCRSGALPCWQKDPGKAGSPIKLSYLAVTLLSRRPQYQKNHARWERSKDNVTESMPGWEDQNIGEFDPRQRIGRALIDHGIYYSTRQVALELGVSVQAVHGLRRRGRLTGHRVPTRSGRSPAHQHWFFLKEDVHDLQADQRYNAHSRQGKEAQCRASQTED